ncbi:hypothetical protein BC827DRAFT_638208 [Russula dissimulans]|nr:hypothetical protein BC827DRAFT_638208 [Russula dissimulans]
MPHPSVTGLMRTTWTQTPISDKEAVGEIRGDINALPSCVFLTGPQFYGPSFNTVNLEPAFSTVTQGSRAALSCPWKADPFLSNWSQTRAERTRVGVAGETYIGLSAVNKETIPRAHNVLCLP